MTAPRNPRTRTSLPNRGQYDTATAAEFLSVSQRQVQLLIDAGHLAAYIPIGMKRSQRITHAELERYVTESAGAVAS